MLQGRLASSRCARYSELPGHNSCFLSHQLNFKRFNFLFPSPGGPDGTQSLPCSAGLYYCALLPACFLLAFLFFPSPLPVLFRATFYTDFHSAGSVIFLPPFPEPLCYLVIISVSSPIKRFNPGFCFVLALVSCVYLVGWFLFPSPCLSLPSLALLSAIRSVGGWLLIANICVM